MRIDSKPDSKSLSGQVTSINDIDKKYDITTYYKGASVIRMIESFLGLETLNKGLTSYLNDKSFNNAKEDDLFIHLEAAALEEGSWPQEGVSDFSSSAAEVIAWYEASETDFVVMRAYIECVTNSHVERSSHRI